MRFSEQIKGHIAAAKAERQAAAPSRSDFAKAKFARADGKLEILRWVADELGLDREDLGLQVGEPIPERL